MQAIGPAPPKTRRRAQVGVTALGAFALFLLLNFWPGWQSMPFLNSGMVLTIGSIDVTLIVIILSNIFYQLSDSPGVHATVHVILAAVTWFLFVRLMRTFPFNLPAGGPWPGVVHGLIIAGAVIAFCAFWVTIWQMIGLNYNAARHGH
jgi:hypothetical protein